MTTEDPGPRGADNATRTETKPKGTDSGDGTPRVVTSESLLAGASQLAILHDRTLYFLRQTRFVEMGPGAFAYTAEGDPNSGIIVTDQGDVRNVLWYL